MYLLLTNVALKKKLEFGKMCILVHLTSLITFYQQNALRTIEIEDMFVEEIIQHLNDF